MYSFKKIFLVVLLAQVMYWLLAGFVFNIGQLMLHATTAVIVATFMVTKLVRFRRKIAWFTPIIWPILFLFTFQALMLWIDGVNWVLNQVNVNNLVEVTWIFTLCMIGTTVSIIIVASQEAINRYLMPHIQARKPSNTSSQSLHA